MTSSYFLAEKKCMTNSESKGQFFTKRIDSHNESNRIDSNRELECSTACLMMLMFNTVTLRYPIASAS